MIYVLILLACFCNEIIPAKYRGNGYKYDPYTNFGKPTSILTVNDFVDDPIKTVVDLYYNKAHQPEDKTLFVLGITEANGLMIVKYNADGEVVSTQGLCYDYALSSKGRALWKDNFFYIPTFQRDGAGNVFKFQYNDGMLFDENFQTDGILNVSVANRTCILTSVVEFDNFCYAGGMSYTEGNNRFLIVKFNNNENDTVIYRENIGDDNVYRCANQMIFYEVNGFIYVLTIDTNEGLWFLKLTDNLNDHVIIPEHIGNNTDVIPHYHGICKYAINNQHEGFFATFLNHNEDSCVASLTFQFDQQGVARIVGNTPVVIEISGIPGIITTSVRFPYITLLGDQLFLGGSYKTVTSGDARYPLVACYNVENIAAPKLDETFFNVGYWYYQPGQFLASETLASPFAFTQIEPSLSLVLGRGSSLIHVYPDFFNDLRVDIKTRVLQEDNKGNKIPFMPHR